MTLAETLAELLELDHAPVAIAFCDEPPEGVPRVAATAPAGCGYWPRAAAGSAFVTEASDHHHCPIGAHTHGIDLPTAQATELLESVQMMIDIKYLRREEVESLPRRPGQFGVAVYAPLADAPCPPDVVLIRGDARQMMLLAEAAKAAGIGATTTTGRPTCAAIPEAMATGRCITNLACIGNRVYTELSDSELYFAVPGRQLELLTATLVEIVAANQELEAYHRGRHVAHSPSRP